jgi:hypothetical protein
MDKPTGAVILRKLLFWRPIAQRAARTAYKPPVNIFYDTISRIVILGKQST